MLPLSVYLDEFAGLPKILVNHNVESVRLQRWSESESNPLKREFLRLQWHKLCRFEKEMINRFDRCIAVSLVDRDVLAGMGITTPIAVVPNGTDTEFFKPMGRPTIPNSVIWFGHMDVHTNRDAVLYFWRDIYPLLRYKIPDVIVSFIGTSPPEEIVDAANCDPNVLVTGFVDDIRPYVDEAAVIVVPIRIGSGTRLKILDAMAMGKAIVSTSVGCEGIDPVDGENICVADTPEEFCDKICQLISNSVLRTKIATNATNFAKAFDWRRITSVQEMVYQEAVGKGTSCEK
jgi:glycosyltransferase involved in cell wall biosynthesis